MEYIEAFFDNSRYLLPALGVALLVYCAVSLARKKIPLPKPAKLVGSSGGAHFELTRWENSVGRSSACDVVLGVPEVSRFHAVISHKHNGWVLIDTNSKLGVFINGQRVKKRAFLVNGDKIDFGGISLIFKT